MTRSNFVDVTVAMSRELLNDHASDHAERLAGIEQLRKEGMSEAEISLVFGLPAEDRQKGSTALAPAKALMAS